MNTTSLWFLQVCDTSSIKISGGERKMDDQDMIDQGYGSGDEYGSPEALIEEEVVIVEVPEVVIVEEPYIAPEKPPRKKGGAKKGGAKKGGAKKGGAKKGGAKKGGAKKGGA